MGITIRPMTDEEYRIFYQWSVEHHAKELMEQLRKSEEEALGEAGEEVQGMLPGGLATANHFLMTIVEESKETAGFIWTIHEEYEGRKQCFICDFAIWESMRRKGYGAAALALAEKQAGEAGCRESVLFVSDDNEAAKALYRKCGYRVLRPEGYGKFMIKDIL